MVLFLMLLQGANPAGTGLAVSWGDLRELYAFPIAAEEFKLNACAASAPPPPGASPTLILQMQMQIVCSLGIETCNLSVAHLPPP